VVVCDHPTINFIYEPINHLTMVNNKLLLPQEIETFYIIPALRRYFAQYLKVRGMKQKDIAELLMVNTAAISQYTSSKRGHRIDFNNEIVKDIERSAAVVHDRVSFLTEMQRVLRLIRETNTLCQIHRKFSDLPEDCRPEIVGCHIVSNVTWK